MWAGVMLCIGLYFSANSAIVSARKLSIANVLSDSKCNELANKGDCKLKRKFMMKKCEFACAKHAFANSPPVSMSGFKMKRNPKCDYWAKRGECFLRWQFMAKNCRITCAEIEQSVDKMYDKNTNCKEEAKQGNCARKPQYLLSACYKSCLFKDKEKRCVSWAKHKQCASNPYYMRVYCTDSCGAALDELDKTEKGKDEEPQIDDTEENVAPNVYPSEKCTRWAHKGDCQTRFIFMQKNCEFSCAKLDEDVIIDTEHLDDVFPKKQCKSWSKRGDCATKKDFMSRNCAASCRKVKKRRGRRDETGEVDNDGYEIRHDTGDNPDYHFSEDSAQQQFSHSSTDNTENGTTDGDFE